jgi:NADH-quinone oxidoreductase subunit N
MPFLQLFRPSSAEYYFLLLAALFGLLLISAAADFLTLFVGLETLSLALYVLCSYVKKWKLAEESSVKYFLLGSLAAAILLYGIAMIYGATGTTNFSGLSNAFTSANDLQTKALFFGGVALITVGLIFKAAVVPFHIWAPDVYDGAPTPVTAFMAVATKAGAFAALIRIFLLNLPLFDSRWNSAIAALSAITLIYANFVAIRQKYLRRFFAYSGISHAGFLLIPIAIGVSSAINALLFYLVVYAMATLGAFAIIMFLDRRSEGVMIADLRGLFYRSPGLCIALALCLLTLAGIPPTAGFFAKFYLFKLAFEAHYFWLLAIALATTILSAFYYAYIISVMLSKAEEPQEKKINSRALCLVTSLSVLAIAATSLFPGEILRILGLTNG